MSETLCVTCSCVLDADVIFLYSTGKQCVRCREWKYFTSMRMIAACEMRHAVSIALTCVSTKRHCVCFLLETIRAFYCASSSYTEHADMLSTNQIPKLTFCCRLLLSQFRPCICPELLYTFDEAVKAFDTVFTSDYECLDSQDFRSPWINDLVQITDIFCYK
jgi:hypothetical protein